VVEGLFTASGQGQSTIYQNGRSARTTTGVKMKNLMNVLCTVLALLSFSAGTSVLCAASAPATSALGTARSAGLGVVVAYAPARGGEQMTSYRHSSWGT